MNKELRSALAWGGALIALALGAAWARRMGYIDADIVERVVIGFNGLMIAWYGNRMPKSLAPSAQARRVARVGGWSMVLSGLVYVGMWVFAPIPVALAAGTAAILVALAVTVGYCQTLRARAKAA